MKKQISDITMGNPKKMLKPIATTMIANLVNMFPFSFMTIIVINIYEYHAKAKTNLNTTILWLLWLGMLVAILLVYWCESKSYRSIYRSAYETSAEGRGMLAEHIRRLPLGYLMSKDVSELGNMMMSDFHQIEDAATNFLPQVVSGVMIPSLAFIGLLFVDWRLSVAMFAGFPFSILIILAVRGLEGKFGKTHSKARLAQANCLQEYLFGIKVIKAYNLGGKNFKTLQQAFSRFMKESIKLEGGLGPFFLVAIAFLQTGLSLITICGVYLLLDGELTVPVFALFLLAGTHIFDPLVVSIMRLPGFKYNAMAGNRIVNLLNQPIMQGQKESPTKHNIKFKNVKFAYDKNIVLDDVSVEMKEGTLTAVVGPSGSGKSTLLKLIARFYDPQVGTVTFGEVNQQEINPESLMKKISMVFQDVYLFQDTIKNNIRYGRENASQDEIELAAKQACCHDFIMKLPKGYDTMVGEGGSTLSGGEKQRISIARAILKDSPVILLDEATSSLDPENELDMQKAINRLIEGRTVIMIAHRLKTVVNADNIIVMERGKILEQGKHIELLSNKKLYKRLWDLQEKTSGWNIVQ
ncbi:ABC transporter ATP-binding protein [Clostridiaceae bacterium M8S5]|nr:ABC transporter ATP-binding protein [Clostridiaceae bacterium M8S5]